MDRHETSRRPAHPVAIRVLHWIGVYGFASGHFRRDLKPPRPAELGQDLGAALRFHLKHHMGHYNAVQRVLYAGVIIAVILQAMTGLAIWRPVQFGWLAGLFGGYPIAGGIHLATMFGIVGFVLHRHGQRAAPADHSGARFRGKAAGAAMGRAAEASHPHQARLQEREEPGSDRGHQQVFRRLLGKPGL
jgi:hypothetical protein